MLFGRRDDIPIVDGSQRLLTVYRKFNLKLSETRVSGTSQTSLILLVTDTLFATSPAKLAEILSTKEDQE